MRLNALDFSRRLRILRGKPSWPRIERILKLRNAAKLKRKPLKLPNKKQLNWPLSRKLQKRGGTLELRCPTKIN